MADNSSLHYDVIVIGTGSMGAAACWFLAKRGHRVLGLEQFDVPHEKGSHAGQTRIIRKAYFEHADYVPLLDRAYENWRSFEKETGTRLYYPTGVLYMGKRDNADIKGVRNSAALHNIPIENWTQEQCRNKYPAFHMPPDFDAIFEPDAGFVTPEPTVERFAREAERHGAAIRTQATVRKWKQEGSIITVTTEEERFTCDKLIITAGAWTSQLLPELRTTLQVTRQLLAWVEPPDPEAFSLERFPCWFVEDPMLGTFYGFPVLQAGKFKGPIGLKLAHHYPGIPCGPDDIGGEVGYAEEEKLQTFLRTYLPGAGENIVAVKHCLYTYSPDAHFIIDHLPDTEKRVVVACGFSGHGFKFVPAVGEILADLAMKGKTELPIGFLGMGRLDN